MSRVRIMPFANGEGRWFGGGGGAGDALDKEEGLTSRSRASADGARDVTIKNGEQPRGMLMIVGA